MKPSYPTTTTINTDIGAGVVDGEDTSLFIIDKAFVPIAACAEDGYVTV